jgi:hypothetical protein
MFWGMEMSIIAMRIRGFISFAQNLQYSSHNTQESLHTTQEIGITRRIYFIVLLGDAVVMIRWHLIKDYLFFSLRYSSFPPAIAVRTSLGI